MYANTALIAPKPKNINSFSDFMSLLVANSLLRYSIA
jgi:hypothetical protein